MNFLFLFIFSFQSFALEQDAKFLARILDLSDTKKTLLVNKGHESGLKVGDHAKLSLPSGLVARAVVAKLSPSRSVWSVYRFYKKERLIKKNVLTFKIASPMKLTSDGSKHLGLLAKPKDPVFEKKQKKLSKQMKRSEGTTKKLIPGKYAALNDSGEPRQRDKDIDWRAIDGKKDEDSFDSGLDYSNLK